MKPRPLIQTLDQKRFWLALREKGAQQRVPVRAMIELTYGCNLRCVHCYNPTHQAKDELSTVQITALIDQLAAVGCLELGLTGGEIFTRRDLFEIMAYAKGKGFAITLLTNATLITPERADRIQALHPRSVEISIYGATQETYEQVTRIPGSFQGFLTGVQLLRERTVPLLIKMPVMTLNQHEVEQAKALVEGWKTLVDLVDSANAKPGDAYECPTCPVQSHCQQGPMNAWLETRRLEPCLPYFKELATLEKLTHEAEGKSDPGP